MFSLSINFLLSIYTFAEDLVPTDLPSENTVQENHTDEAKKGLLGEDFGKQPTYVKSDTLTLKAEDHFFVYQGNVQVKQADMLLTADKMEGNYTEDNQIKDLTAVKNVVITKGINIRANSEKAFYDATNETVTLTENPELQQDGSVLTADKIIIFLEEDRSVAEGQVRVKLIENEEKDANSSNKTLKIR
ncbi:MAG: hypothetical protein KDD56_04775 [Bdellovibrionales bacterium]|nr:hypothetical protein [Bdellovibrionales bacterium]